MIMSRLYMRNVEFKERQMWLDFECAVGIALRVVAGSIEDMRKWFKGWKGVKPKVKAVNKARWLWIELSMIESEFMLG